MVLSDKARLADPPEGLAPASTLYDVAREAGVSTATVSRVVHGHDRVKATTRQRVLDVIEALGYVPDGAAQSLSRKRKQVVGLVAVASRGPESDIEQTSLLFVEEVLRGVESSLGEIGWSLLISFVQAGDCAYRRLQSLSGKVDGLLIAEGIVSSHELARLRARLPIALVAGSPDEPRGRRRGRGQPVRHQGPGLPPGRGARLYPAVLRGRPGGGAGRDRPPQRLRRGAHRAQGHAAAGYYEGRFSAISGKQAAQELMALPDRDLPDAIVCANDQMAIGAMRELQAGGLRVPEDIAVVGFDDIYPGSLIAPSLTTVRQPMRQLGERACSRLLERIADPGLPHRAELLPTELIVRESCGCPSLTVPSLHADAGSARRPLISGSEVGS